MQIDEDKVTQAVQAREYADDMATMIQEDMYGTDAGAHLEFLIRLIARLRADMPDEKPPEQEPWCGPPMMHEEARDFETQTMLFGKWANHYIHGVPIDYLLWLEGEDDFRKSLNRYLRSDVGQARQGEDD